MIDIPDNVDLKWIARHLVDLRDDLKRNSDSTREDLLGLRDHVDVAVASALRIERGQAGIRDDIRRLYEMHRDLRGRVSTLEKGE